MEILPLLIFIGGIIYTAISSQKDKGKDEERNIDPSKMDRPTRPSAPRRRQPESTSQPKGIFDDMVGEIERRFSGETKQQSSNAPQSRPVSERRASESQRPKTERSFGRSLEEKTKESPIGRRANDVYQEKAKKVENSDWAERARQEVRDRKGSERSERTENDARGTRRQQEPEAQKPRVRKEALSFGRKDIVNGIIFSEIIGKPRSRK